MQTRLFKLRFKTLLRLQAVLLLCAFQGHIIIIVDVDYCRLTGRTSGKLVDEFCCIKHASRLLAFEFVFFLLHCIANETSCLLFLTRCEAEWNVNFKNRFVFFNGLMMDVYKEMQSSNFLDDLLLGWF